MASLLDLVIENSVGESAFQGNQNAIRAIRALRVLRAFRPLRMVQRNQGLKVAVNALFSAIPAVINVTLVSFLFLGIFSIMSVNFYKGLFYSCTGIDTATLN